MEEQNNIDVNSMVQSSTMLLTFEGWIKYIEGFSRGLQTTKTVDASQVFDCVGEIMEYMKTLKGQLMNLLIHCEDVLTQEEDKENQLQKQEKQIQKLLEENKQLTEQNEQLQNENNELKTALEKIVLKEKQDGQM